MNARTRMARAMARQRPDRVPVMCQLALGHTFLHAGADPVEIWHDGDAFASALVALQRRYGFDGILVNLPGRDPQWRRRIAGVDEDDGVQRVRWHDGRVTDVPPDDNPHVLVGPDGAPPTVRFEDVDPERLFYVEPHDLAGVTWPTSFAADGTPAEPGSRAFFPPWQADTLRSVLLQTGGEVSVHAEVFSPFTQLMELCGYQDALLALCLDEGKVRACLEALGAGALCLADLYAEAGCDALLISSAFVGAGFVSRTHYARFELPFVRRIVDGLRARHRGLPVYVHTCGRIGDRLDLLEATGVDGIDTFDPPPIGDVELADALERLGGRVFVKGNLDPVHTLLEGSVDDVRRAARDCLAAARAFPGYVLSSACSVPPHTPPENLTVLREVAEAFDG